VASKSFSRIAATLIAVALNAHCVRGVNRQDNMNPSNETKPNPSSTAAARKLRILCLHGYHGSADVLRAQMSSLASGLGALAEFVYVDAPARDAGDFGWWHAVATEVSPERGDPGVPPGERRYEGWPKTRAFIEKVFREQGPFDGVFGFSQGAALTGLLVGLRAPDGRPTADQPLVFNFAMMVGGFPTTDSNLASLYAAKSSYALPSVHIIGRADGIVPSAISKALAAKFQDPLILQHDGGHIIAATADIRQQVENFLEEQRRKPAAGAAPVRPTEVALWAGRAHPTMRFSFPADAGSKVLPAFLVFQGGAYATCFGSGGGSAEFLAAHGIAGILVEYGTRGTGQSYPANYADAARAMRLVRQNARDWGIDPNRIGVLGYSAGGHLASLLSTQPSLWMDPADDLAGHVSARPDLVALSYPVISFVDGYSPGAFVSSAENFFGHGNLDEDLRRQFSNELHVTAQHAPVFIWTTQDDGLVPYTHSQKFAEACRQSGVPVVFTLYPHGPHGLGLAQGYPGDIGQWTNHFVDWLTEQWGKDSVPSP
jgi:acetyl esterase/lipase